MHDVVNYLVCVFVCLFEYSAVRTSLPNDMVYILYICKGVNSHEMKDNYIF